MFISGNLPLSKPCPCGSENSLGQCCGIYLQGQLSAPTAEKLMRSRYTAYCLKNIDYLFKTEHPSRHLPNTRELIAATANSVQWLGLTIVATDAGQTADDKGIVEFMAVFKEGGQAAQLHERSRFVKEKGKWFYVEGDILSPLRPKKNEPCWCHSGKKFKQCHGKKR